MEFANDFMASLRGRVAPGAKALDLHGLDWPGLHARLCAAHAARTEFESSESRLRPAVGDFSCWAGAADSEVNPSQRVNLTDSTDGKAIERNAVPTAEHSKVGG